MIHPVLRRPRAWWTAGIIGSALAAAPGCSGGPGMAGQECEASGMRVHFVRSGGFAGMQVEARLDTDSLPEADARTLCDLIDAAGFFDLPSEVGDTTGADQFAFQITVTTDKREHTVTASGSALPPAVQQLVDWLGRAARRSRSRS